MDGETHQTTDINFPGLEPTAEAVAELLDQIASLPPIPLLYFGTMNGGRAYWPYDQAPAVVTRAQSAEVIVYPTAISA